MTMDELQATLLGKTYPGIIQISADQTVTDAETFLKIQFIEMDLWTKEIEKCPAYLRLLKFYQATVEKNKI